MAPALNLKIVVGSTREARRADAVVPWVVGRAVEHGAFAVEVADLRTHRLPMFGEEGPGSPAVKALRRVIGDGDAFAFVTPEYNHSVPGVLKNAIDSVSGALRNRAAGFVGYSTGLAGGARAVEHLAHIVIEAEMVPLRNAVLLAQVHQLAFDGDRAEDPARDGALDILLDDLAWWGEALRRARAGGELPPAGARKVAA